jgi:hypothetical protein
MIMLRNLASVLLLVLFAQAQPVEEKSPMYKGYECIGWAEPQADQIANGHTTGEELAVNIELTAVEKKWLRVAEHRASEAFEYENQVQATILKSHGFEAKDQFGDSPCGEFVGIRSGEEHITQFVPSNPLYPSDSAHTLGLRESPAYCREYFAKLRTKAVKATYGREMRP